MNQYLSLRGEAIVQTAERLESRVRERFRSSSLAEIADDLVTLSQRTRSLSRELSRPWWPVRTTCLLGMVVLAGAVVGAVTTLDLSLSSPDFGQGLQIVESAVNDAVFIGVGAWFFLSLESRLKRRRALGFLHQLRAIAHIIDMHQLTKDPERTTNPRLGTASSPTKHMTPFLLTRYLDYCAEMLALVGKLSALVAQGSDDPVLLGAVNDVESLTSGLSRKIWQKIDVVGRMNGRKLNRRQAAPATPLGAE